MANTLRHFLFPFVLLATAQVVVGQAELRLDQEYIATCLVDSLPDGSIVRFQRITLIGDRSFFDIDELNAPYTPTGTVKTCEEYDLSEIIRDPYLDQFDNCQCVYTINQENHYVKEVRGGSDQDYIVEFQEVVRRQCTGQESQVIVHRDTLQDTTALNTAWKLNTGIPFNAPGQIVEDFNVRLYGNGGTVTTITVDLDPATVQASYPALTLDPADFTYDGSNNVAVAAAYELVINHAVSQLFGAPVNPITATPSGVSGTVTISHQLFHQPNYPYVILPRAEDDDFLIVTTAPSNLIALGQGSSSATTQTNNYLDACGVIWTRQTAIYLTWNRLAPLSLIPIIDPPQTLAPASVPTVSCATDPQVCANIIPTNTDINGCVEECTDLLNLAGHLPVNQETVTLAAGVYNSISIFVTNGPVQIEIDGLPINYPTNWSSSWSASPRKTLNNSITITAPAGSEAIISYVR